LEIVGDAPSRERKRCLRGHRNRITVGFVPRIRLLSERKSEARRMRRVRDALRLSQREMAKEFKVAHGAIAGWESGTRTLPGPVSKLLELYEEELGLSDEDSATGGIKTSFAARNFALSKAAGNVLVRAVAGLLARWLVGDEPANSLSTRARAALALNLAGKLSELKGLAMKAGQTLGYVDFLLSEESRLELDALMSSSRPLPTSHVAREQVQSGGTSSLTASSLAMPRRRPMRQSSSPMLTL
jgi:transcriptional regulator with XRE-family HTH domain